MNKVFLYLYPIQEFQKMFIHSNDYYESENIPKPLPILNQCIQKRYREKGYQVVFALYPDKEIYGIEPQNEDKIIYSDITFDEATAYDSNGKEKQNFTPKYPSEEHLLSQLGAVDELIVGGYHSQDCVKRVAEAAQRKGIKTLVDLDLTDLFFGLYRKSNYFNISEYSPKRYKESIYKSRESGIDDILIKVFKRNFASPVYGFHFEKEDDFER